MDADVDQANIANKKKELSKKTVQVKSRQKEVQTAELELRELQCSHAFSVSLTQAEQSESDLEAAQAEVAEAYSAHAKSEAEHAALEATLQIHQVSPPSSLISGLTFLDKERVQSCRSQAESGASCPGGVR